MKREVSIAIPASVVSDTPHLREKTAKIGVIGRAAAIFRANQIIIYRDNSQATQIKDAELTSLLLSYMETPQYLRKRLFTLKPDLQYAGILPPLRTPHHPLNRRADKLRIGEYREGVTVSKTSQGVLVDIGVERPILLTGKQALVNKRVTAHIVKTGTQITAELVNREEIPVYWGYTVTLEKQSLGEMLKRKDFELTIATSKYGMPFTDVAEQITGRWLNVKTILVVFGSPARGLYEITKAEGFDLADIVDYVVNMIPEQGTETVRTEEALFAALSVFNMCYRLIEAK